MLYTDWRYKRVLTDGNSTAVTAFQVRVALTADNFTFSHANSDGSDIRFWDATSGAALPYWIESWDAVAQTAVIWVKVADMTHTLEMYYGRTTATSESSLANTFEDSYDFETAFGITDLLVPNATAPQTTPTYDGSGQLMHPSVWRFDSAWNGYLYWMVGTPYPASAEAYENPSIIASNDGETWVVPDGLTNPLDTPPVDGHLADTNIVYDPDADELRVYYLRMDDGANLQTLMLVRSSDGVTWSEPEALNVTCPLDGDVELSPAVVRRSATEWHYWAYNYRHARATWHVVHRTSTDGLTWGESADCTLSSGPSPLQLEVRWIESLNCYLMMVSPNLWLQTSTDGVTWSWPSTSAVMYGRAGEWDAMIYKATVVAEGDLLRFWYTGYNGYAWHTGYTSKLYSDLFESHTADAGDLNPDKGGGLWPAHWTRISSTISTWLRSTEQYKRGGHSGKLIGGASPELKLSRIPAVKADAYYEIDFYDPGPAFVMWKCRPIFGALMIGANDSTSAAYYVTSGKGWSYEATTAPRSVGWHKFGILVTSGGVAKMYVDDVLVKEATGQYASIAWNEIGSQSVDSTTYWDDFRVRKYAATEPSIVVGAEQEQGMRGMRDSIGLRQLGVGI